MRKNKPIAKCIKKPPVVKSVKTQTAKSVKTQTAKSVKKNPRCKIRKKNPFENPIILLTVERIVSSGEAKAVRQYVNWG